MFPHYQGERNMTIKLQFLDGSVEEFESLDEIDSSRADLWGAIIIKNDMSEADLKGEFINNSTIQNEKGV